ncbi:Asp23/Gls24 family envelope stress response protein [Blastococcus sp. TF02A-26]|uniref:Asp23/Gls24 family envelope stress response protein n=1 Tax=Blastococcus sp. TF02A-26 TaxID=2250577 RepID=UPI0013145AA5|nr:Asp23/Gls24 family envelope stress response protein [Blastococcus sp. TF02A-26]
MDPTRADGDDRLPCGVSVHQLLIQVTDRSPAPDPAHQQTCPHCRAVLAELTELWTPVAELAAEEIRAPAALLEAVIDQIRELSGNAWHAVLAETTGRTRIAARVVGAIARLAAESVPHVSVALGGGRPAGTPDQGRTLDAVAGPAGERATEIGVAGTHVVIDIQIAVDYGEPIAATAQLVRERIAAHIAAQTGLTTSEINVNVVDVQARPGSARH